MLQSKTALITGASSGIGHAMAQLFARNGARLVVTARRAGPLHALVAEITAEGGEAIAVPGDITGEDHARALVEAAEAHFGGLDIAINNAGTLGAMGEVTQMRRHDWDATLTTNLTAAFLGAKYQIPALLKRKAPALLFTSTFVGHTIGMPGMAAYGASKAGLIGLTQCLAAEYGPLGLRVNALLPGGTDTPMGASVADTDAARAHVEGLHALKRLAGPGEIAQAALFLASEQASFITGTALLADGGISISRG